MVWDVQDFVGRFKYASLLCVYDSTRNMYIQHSVPVCDIWRAFSARRYQGKLVDSLKGLCQLPKESWLV